MKYIYIVLLSILLFPLFTNDLNSIIDSSVRFGKWQEASVQLSDYVYSNPQNQQALNILGIVQIQLKQYDLALSTFRKALSVSDNDEKKSNVYYNIGTAYYLQNNYPASKEMFLKATQFNPLSAGSYYFLGIIAFDSNLTKEAVSCWQKYLAYSSDVDKKNKISAVISKIQQYELDEKLRKEDEERRKNDLMYFLKNQLDSKSEQTSSFQDYKINKDTDDEEEFELID